MKHTEIDQTVLTHDLMIQLLRERRSEKRWKNIRFFIILLAVIFVIVAIISAKNVVSLGTAEEGDYISLVRLDGSIEPGKDFSAEQVLPILRDAFADKKTKGVILDINSGGGTPVQASIIHDAIVDMKKKFHKKVIVVGEDIMASGAYFVAVAGDKIYVNPNTITGSIGVVMKGFGFTDLLKKIGIERRVYTSGINKDRLDPFLPQSKEDIEKIRAVMSEVHSNFNQIVMEGRGNKLHTDQKDLFTGDFWSGQTALKLGLVDGLGNLPDVMQAEFQVSRYRDYSLSQNVIKNAISQVGMSLDMFLNNDGVKVLEQI